LIKHKGVFMSLRFCVIFLVASIFLSSYTNSQTSQGRVFGPCWDQAYYSGSGGTACPPRLTSASGGPDISTTTSKVSVTSSSSSGTLYMCYSTVSTKPTYIRMISGSGDAYTCANDSSPIIGVNEFNLTGLQSNTQYYTWFLQIDSRGHPSQMLSNSVDYVVSTSAWRTLPVAPDPEPPPGPVPPGSAPNLDTFDALFVDSVSGNDSNSCRSSTAPCKTLQGAKSKGTPLGRDLYLKSGSSYQTQLDINWSGSSTDRVIVGCYYRDATNNNKATSCELGGQVNSQVKPIIRGTYTDACRAIKDSAGKVSCAFEVSSAIPPSRYGGLVQSTRQQYVTIQDLQVLDSAGGSIVINEDNTLASKAIIQRNFLRQSAGTGIQINKAVVNSRAIIRYNVLSLSVLSRPDKLTTGNPPLIFIATSEPSLSREPTKTYGLVEGNLMYDNWGEQIDFLKTANNIARGNIIADKTRASTYLDNGSHNVVEHNLYLGDGRLDNPPGSDTVGVGLEAYDTYERSIDRRVTKNAVGNVIRNNVIANSHALRITMLIRREGDLRNCGGKCINPVEEGYMVGGKFVGNSLLYLVSDWAYVNNILTNENIESGSSFVNNLIQGTTTCDKWNKTYPSDKIFISNNVFNTLPASSTCRGVNYTVGTSGIPNPNSNQNNIPSYSSLYPATGSAADNAGTPRTSKILDVSNYPQFSDFSWSTCEPSAADWEKELAYDFECKPRSATTPTAGAFETTK
jgi:hypothetical protein